MLNVVAERTLAQQPGSKNLLKLYERWLKTGSETICEELALHGIFPTRATKGVQ